MNQGQNQGQDYRITYWDGFGKDHPYYDEKLKRNRFTREEALKLAKGLVPHKAVGSRVTDGQGGEVRSFGRVP